ncbi:MAG: hypothetical protein IK114_14390 [Fibrobacter sp.]|nr:hypothetical protein [Fibrobacter sp.]
MGQHVVHYKTILAMKAAAERVDALTMLCRSVLRASSICYVDGALVYFDGKIHAAVRPGVVLDTLNNILMDSGTSPYDIRRMGDLHLTVLSEKSYPRSPYLAFSNGVLNVNTMEWSEGFNPQRIVTEYLDYAYDGYAQCPLWDKFLKEIMPDECQRLVLQEFFGMVYLDRSGFSVEKFALFVGKGANGKSVIFEVMKRVIGEANVTTLDSVQLSDEKMLPYVKGARLNFSPDMASQKDFSSALKALASGQDVTGRKIYGEAEKIKCPPLCFAMNELPRFRDVTDAFFRRILLFTFEVQIPPHRQDKRLVERICSSDRPGIMNWILDGRFRLMRNGGEFTYSEKMEKDLNILRGKVRGGGEYPVKSWLESRGLSVYPSYNGQAPVMISRQEIYDGLGGAVSTHMITRELTAFGVQPFRSKVMKYKVYEKV